MKKTNIGGNMPENNVPAVKEDGDFAIFRAEREKVRDIVSLNLRGKKLRQFDLERITIPSGGAKHWTIPGPDGDQTVDMIEGVLLYYKNTRSWWPDMDPTGKPPKCKSEDAIVGFGSRFEDEEPGRHDCLTCPHAEFGSDPKHHRGQWCKEKYALFILMKDTFLPHLIMIPATSLEHLQKWIIRLTTYGKNYNEKVMGFLLEPATNQDGQKYNKVVPKGIRDLNPEEYEIIRGYTESVIPALKSVELASE